MKCCHKSSLKLAKCPIATLTLRLVIYTPQAGEAFPITIVFKPRAALLQQCARFLTEPGGSVIEVPMKVRDINGLCLKQLCFHCW